MTYDSKLFTYAQVFAQDGSHIGLRLEDSVEVLEPENLKMGDQLEKHADEEEDGGPVHP